MTDISGVECILTDYDSSPFKKWIKLISIDKTILFDRYHRKDYFKEIIEIHLDTDINKKGNKKRNTVLKFIPKVPTSMLDSITEWIYIFVMNGRIVKIGGTRKGIQNRMNSYLCGHHIKERGKSGDCSKTNAFIYNTFEFYLKLGCDIKVYAYNLPPTNITIPIFEKDTEIQVQTYHAFESHFLKDYKEHYDHYPILNTNCDPQFRQ